MPINNPDKPILAYDGDCAFCKLWVDYFKSLTGDKVGYSTFQTVGGDFPDIHEERFRKSVTLITEDGEVFDGAEATFRVLSVSGRALLLWMYREIPGFASVSESAYRLAASNRSFLYRVTRLLWGERIGPHSFLLSRWLFLRLLGIVFFIAFASFWVQIPGLIGENGISPADIFLRSAEISEGGSAYWHYPTLVWLNYSDWFISLLAISGMALSALLIIGVFTIPTLLILYILYLSLVVVGQQFMSFQWDVLLLETAFLSLFLAPWGGFPKLSRRSPPYSLVLWLFYFLLFRLMFSSGLGKITSGDPTWQNFTALNFHYFTQPLPTPLAWYFHQLPVWFDKASVGVMFFIEALIPFFFFAPRRIRFLAGGATILLQILIALTGNYTFFNLLSVVLCVLLFDDTFLRKLIPERLRPNSLKDAAVEMKISSARKTGIAILAVIVIFLGTLQLAKIAVGFQNLPAPFQNALRSTYPLRLVNSYGLFTVMTTRRPEIIVEGSNDGERWLEYEFKYKPGDLDGTPSVVAPHQPRLDWQMWFAALGSYRTNHWFVSFIEQLLVGSTEVSELIEKNPFPDEPPKFIRASVYEYRFTDMNAEENWWKREYVGLYLPVLSLKER